MHSSKVSRGPSAVLGSDQLVFPAPFTLATTLQSKTHVVPSSSKQPVSSGSYLIHKSTPCRVAQVIFVCPSCSSWLSHLKMGGGAVMAKQCQIFPALVCHQSELIFLQSYELSSRANTCSLGFPTANDLPGPASECKGYNSVSSSRSNKAALGISAKPTLTQRLSTNS